jgi:hypothetical protein
MNGTSFKYGIQSDHTLRWYLVQHSASILHVGPQRHQNPIHFEWSAHECTSPPKPACAFIITWTKVNLSGFIPSQVAHLTYISCKNVQLHGAWCHWNHLRFHQSPSQSDSHVFLCLISGYLSFVYNQNSESSWSARYSLHPRHKWCHMDRTLH